MKKSLLVLVVMLFTSMSCSAMTTVVHYNAAGGATHITHGAGPRAPITSSASYRSPHHYYRPMGMPHGGRYPNMGGGRPRTATASAPSRLSTQYQVNSVARPKTVPGAVIKYR